MSEEIETKADLQKPKKIKINLDLTETNVFKNQPYETNEMFWTTDINSAYLEFSTITEITNGQASLVLKNIDDGSIVQRTIEVTESPFYYMLREVEVVRAGRWYGQIVVEVNGKALTATVYRFKIQGSLLDSTNPALIDIDNYNKLSSQLMNLYDQFNEYLDDVELSEEKRELAESTRKTLFEDSQKARELAFEASQSAKQKKFESSETERENLFEVSQSEKTTTFEQSEIDRIESFTKKENNRDSVFETNEMVRKGNEIKREAAESKRVAADSTRDETFQSSQINHSNIFARSESSRTEVFNSNETERQTNEHARKSDELTRSNAEVARKLAETTRTTNEATRQTNETNRVSSFNSYDGRINKLEEDVVNSATKALNELRRLDNEKANKKQEEWITPTLLNGWEPYDAVNSIPKYRKNEFGRVFFKGSVKRSSGSGAMFTLPIGYRIEPRYVGYFNANSNNTTGAFIYISGGFNVISSLIVAPHLSLDGISFEAGA